MATCTDGREEERDELDIIIPTITIMRGWQLLHGDGTKILPFYELSQLCRRDLRIAAQEGWIDPERSSAVLSRMANTLDELALEIRAERLLAALAGYE